MRLESQQNKTIKLGRYEFNQRQWNQLHDVLHDNRWHWTRRTIAKAKIFEQLTERGIYRAITEDFERLSVVENSYVSGYGRHKLRGLSGLDQYQ